MEFSRAANIDIVKYILNDDYVKRIKHDLSCHVQDGVNAIIDSLRCIFKSYSPYKCNMIKCLLKSF